MRHLLWVSAILVLSFVLVGQGQDPVYKLSVNVPIVSLEAVVKDSSGRPLTHLSQADFEIHEDGVPQDIKYFEASESPRMLMLVFDATGVMENSGAFMRRAMQALFMNIRPQDQLAVGAIGPEFEMLMNFRKLDKNKLPNVKLPATRIGSNLYESLEQAARRFPKDNSRKAVIALTDGRETFMFRETQRLGYVQPVASDDEFKVRLANARKRGVPYYFLAMDTDPRYIGQYDMEYAHFKNPDGYMRTPQYATGQRRPTIAEDYLAGVKLRMEMLGEATGGKVTYIKNIAESEEFVDQISRELGHSYSMGYYPKQSLDDGKVHKIEIKTKAGYKVEQSRNAYGGLK